MIMLEFKEDALMKAWDELKEAKSGLKHAKHSLCNLEDFMYQFLRLSESTTRLMEQKKSTKIRTTSLWLNTVDVAV